MGKFLEFPKDFLWGGASAAEQVEGHGNTGKGLTVWDKFYQEDPDAFWEKVGPEITSDFFNQYESDFDIFKSFNTNSIRLGISWARVMPDGKSISEKGMQFYRDVVDSATKKGIKLVLNLFHFDMPLWAHEEGNWASKEVIEKFVKFADIIMNEFSDKVDYIATFNEPGVPVIGGYQGYNHWPRVKDNKLAFQVGYGILLAHAKVVKLFREKYSDRKAKIGAVINVNPPIVKDGKTGTEADKKAAWTFDLLHNNFWLYPMIKGEWPKGGVEFAKENNVVPEYTEEEIKIIKETKIDFLGANYYSPTRIVASNVENPECFFDGGKPYHYDKARYNVFRGWEIRPESLGDLAKILREEFDNIPFFISENGMGVEGEEQFRDSSGQIQDDYRIAFLQEHLEELHKAIQKGSNCFGYHMWAITDNWSWRNAYKNRYGFVEIDLKDQSRKLKKSAEWFKETIASNGFDNEYKKIEETIDLAKAKYTPSV